MAREFAEAIKAEYPDKMLAYNCSPSFNWKRHLDDSTIAKFQRELGHMGYKFQFITLAGFHSLNYSMFDLAHGYAHEGMTAYVELQEREFAAERARLHRHPPPARGRHRLLRPGEHRDLAGLLDHGPEGLHRGGAVHRGALTVLGLATPL